MPYLPSINLKKIFSLFTLLLFLSFHLTAAAQPSLPGFTTEADAFLKKYVSNGRVNYDEVKQNAPAMQALVTKIGNMKLQGISDNGKKAFYSNAYNLLVIQAVANQYPLKSVMDKPGFFDKTTHLVAGDKFTLNDLEKKKLLQPYQDARLHFALACAAVSCLPLAAFAYTSENINNQLEARTKLALNNPIFIRVSKKDRKVLVSQIFDWYKPDFTRDNQTVPAFLNKFRTDKIPADYLVDYYEYDWSLNKQ